jgi:hypothetical protein
LRSTDCMSERMEIIVISLAMILPFGVVSKPISHTEIFPALKKRGTPTHIRMREIVKKITYYEN